MFANDEDAVWELVVETTSGPSEIHRVTDNHPYYVEGQGWVEVADLTVGMTIATMEGNPVTLASITNTGKIERTYNFEVADFHTYFVGDQHVLVHSRGGEVGSYTDTFEDASGKRTTYHGKVIASDLKQVRGKRRTITKQHM